MGENTKFNAEEIDLESLMDELTLDGQGGSLSKWGQGPTLDADADAGLDADLEKNESSIETINAESIENTQPLKLIPDIKKVESVEKSEDIAKNSIALPPALVEENIEEQKSLLIGPVEKVVEEPVELEEPIEGIKIISLTEPAEKIVELEEVAELEESEVISLAEVAELEESEVISLAEVAELEESEVISLAEVAELEESEVISLAEVAEEVVELEESIKEPEILEFKKPTNAEKIPIEKNDDELHTMISTSTEELSVQTLPQIPINTNSSLKTAEYLSIAQNKIIDLQKMIETLHEESANVAAAGELWKQRSHDFEQDLTDLKTQHDNVQLSKEAEQKIFTISMEKQNQKIEHLKKDLSEADLFTEEKLNTYKLIASDLENRIEIIDREKLTLLDGKNKFISDLQKQINTLQKINTNDKKKLQQVSNLINEKEQTLRNTIKLLRQTLISLEIGDTENSELSLAS